MFYLKYQFTVLLCLNLKIPFQGYLVSQIVKKLPAIQETQV